jgi:hypothetical protein
LNSGAAEPGGNALPTPAEAANIAIKTPNPIRFIRHLENELSSTRT